MSSAAKTSETDRRCPEPNCWNDWVLGQVDGNEESRLTAHLDDCVACRERVDHLSDRDAFYAQSRLALRSTGLTSHHLSSDADAELPASHEDEVNEGIVSLVRSLLGPTEYEGSLGRLGRFEVLGVVGSGGMGIVLKARNVDIDRIVAIKIPQPQYWQSADALMTLEREARSAASVVHPNVIAIYHVDRYCEVPYLVMPYLPGQSLQHRVRSQGAFQLGEALRIVRQVASALSAAHACGVVHRDVKPANILLSAGTERVVLSDFGLAKVQSDATCTATGSCVGTPIYLSPEQATGEGAGPPGDLFSLGTVLWTMLVGHPPLEDLHAHAIVRKIADCQLPTLRSQRDGLPPWLYRFVDRLHACEPADRPDAGLVAQWAESCERHLIDPQRFDLPEALMTETKTAKGVGLLAAVCVALAVIIAPVIAATGLWNENPANISETNAANESVDTAEALAPNVAPSASQHNDVENASSSETPWDAAANQLLNDVAGELHRLDHDVMPRWEKTLNELESLSGQDDVNGGGPGLDSDLQ